MLTRRGRSQTTRLRRRMLGNSVRLSLPISKNGWHPEVAMVISVLGVSGSPHRHGNTETLLDSFLDGAKTAGASVEKVVLRDLDYSPCRGCNACHKTGECIVRDDAIALFDKILKADAIAVASPIYSMGITAELKGLIDRGQYLWARKFILKTLYFTNEHIQRHKGIFISTAG